MFDTRPLERVTSAILLVNFIVLPLVFGAVLSLGVGLMGKHTGAYGAGLACCTLVGTPLFALPLLVLFRWTRTGRAQSFLDEVAAGVGDGEVSVATLVWSLLSPRLSGEVSGFPYTVTLRRSAGFLTPPTVGNKFLIWGWMYDVRVDAQIGARFGFGQVGTGDLAATLFGLGAGVDEGSVRVFPGSSARGKELCARPAVREASAAALAFSGLGQLVRVGPDQIVVSGILTPGVTPAEVAGLVRDLGALAAACRD